MPAHPLQDRTHFTARALLLGERLELRELESTARLASSPLVLQAGENGCAVLFRYGALVLFNVDQIEEAALLKQLKPFVHLPNAEIEKESLEIRIEKNVEAQLVKSSLIISDSNIERLQLIADILAKSVILAEYESRIKDAFDRAEPLAKALEHHGVGSPRRARELIRHIGSGLHSLHRMVGRVEVGEKPELIWEHPELEVLFLRLEDEFELKERQLALERKLDVITRTAQTHLDLLQAGRSLRVEWYIVILIVVEILLTLYELFIRGH